MMQKLSGTTGMKNLLAQLNTIISVKHVTNSVKSGMLPATSGVLQGLVLVLMYINDLSSHVDCSVGLFADDIFMGHMIHDE